MPADQDPAVMQMQSLVQRWNEEADQRAIFLRCYMMMTQNMLTAIDQGEFHDDDWVDRLLHRFADYYFNALEAFENNATNAPAVWQQAHQAAHTAHVPALEKLLMGVNAHINYDLVLTLRDLLEPEWAGLTKDQRQMRYQDHHHVNAVIGRTINAVQDQVLEPAQPVMELFDRLMGPVDELLISGLISQWRETVWHNATRLLAAVDADEQNRVLQHVEHETLRLGERIHRIPFRR